MENSHFIHAYHLNKSGKTQALTPDNNTTLPEPKQGYYWLHMCALSADTREYLENNTDLERLSLTPCWRRKLVPALSSRINGVLVILRAINVYEGEDPEDMISIQMWIDEDKVITVKNSFELLHGPIQRCLRASIA